MEMLGIFMDKSKFLQFLPQNKDANTRQNHVNNTRQLNDKDDAAD